MPDSQTTYEAIVLLGPSGVGKSPLGEMFARHGLDDGRACVHFDFGAQLRRLVAENRPSDWVSSDELTFLRDVLESGALLEDDRLPLALRILQGFLAQHEVDPSTLVVLNGLPRHAGQATGLEAVVRPSAVVYLRCDEQSILDRIAGNVGGDREDREDDDRQAVLRRFRTFRERTASLVDYYRRGGAKIVTIDVTGTMTPEAAWRSVQTALAVPQ